MGLALPLSREAGAIRQLVVFELDGQRYALRLDVVERVLRTAEIRPLPGAPEVVLGLVNLEGQVIPVFDPRRRFGLPPREVQLSDVLIIARTRRLTVALAADATGGVLAREGDAATPAGQILPGPGYIEGVVNEPDGLVLIHDLDAFLSLDEEQTLHQAMAAVRAP